MSASSLDENVQRCTQWLAAAGADVATPVVVAHPQDPSERCLQVSKRVPAGKRVLWLPEERLITCAAVRRSPLGQRLQAAGVDHSHALLTAFVCVEGQNPASPWAPYLATLPQTFEQLPSAQLATMVPVLVGTWALQFLMLDARIAMEAFTKTRAALDNFNCDMNRYMWAATAVRTRTFGGTWDGESVSIMAPLADMINHASDADIAWECTEKPRGFELTAKRALATGREVFTSYGVKSNSILFARYGFTLPGNPLREAVIRSVPGAALSQVKQAYLGGPGPFSFPVQPVKDHPQTVALFSHLRVLAATDTEVEALAARNVPCRDVPSLSRANEGRALAQLHAMATKARAMLTVVPPGLAALPPGLAAMVRGLREEEASVVQWFMALFAAPVDSE